MPVTAPPTITALPAAPDPNDRATFNARAYPWAAAQAVLASEVGAAAENMYDNALIAETSATEAEYAATAAAGAANFKGAWSGLTGALAIPASVSHGGAVYMLGANVADVTAHTPGVSASWIVLSPIRRLSIFETAAATSAPVSGLELAENANVSVGASIAGVSYGAGLFVADVVGASGNVYTSPDGITWTARAMPSSAVWRVAFGNGIFIACVQGATTTAKSTDGITWSSGGSLPAAASSYAVPIYAGGAWIVDTSGGAIGTSSNGTSWASGSLPTGRGAGRSIGSGTAAIYWTSGNSGYRYVAYNAWSAVTLPFTPASAFHVTQDFDGALLACNQSAGSSIYRTTDGITWTNTGRVYTEQSCTINGIPASFGSTIGEAISWHNGASMVRRSKGAFNAPDYTKRIATNGSGVFIVPSSVANCITRIAPGAVDAAKAAFI